MTATCASSITSIHHFPIHPSTHPSVEAAAVGHLLTQVVVGTKLIHFAAGSCLCALEQQNASMSMSDTR